MLGLRAGQASRGVLREPGRHSGRLRQPTGETPEGGKRAVAMCEAAQVGASLKFATAKVERATERGPSDRNQAREPANRTRRRLQRPTAILRNLRDCRPPRLQPGGPVS